MKKPILTLALLAGLTTFAGNAKAQTTLFDNGSPITNYSGGYFADAAWQYYQAGNIFIPTASGIANVVDFAGTYWNGGVPVAVPPSDSFTLSLYSVSSGTPDSIIASSTLSGLTRTSLGVIDGFTGYEFSGFLNTPFTLNSSTSYYLGISDQTTGGSYFSILKTAISGSATAEFSHNTNGTFVSRTDSLSFDLKNSAVPEPSTYALLGLGAIGMLMALRRKKTA